MAIGQGGMVDDQTKGSAVVIVELKLPQGSPVRLEMPGAPEVNDTIRLLSGNQFKVQTREWVNDNEGWHLVCRVTAWDLGF